MNGYQLVGHCCDGRHSPCGPEAPFGRCRDSWLRAVGHLRASEGPLISKREEKTPAREEDCFMDKHNICFAETSGRK